MLTGYLKWEDSIVGNIYNHDTIHFVNPNLNRITAAIIGDAKTWERPTYVAFLEDRIVSRHRRDINNILYKLKLADYDAIKIAEITHAFNPKDLFWVSTNLEESFHSAINGSATAIFKGANDVVSSPNGVNIKYYTVSHGHYGIAKKRLHPFSTDIEAEVAVYKLGKIFGVNVCPAWFIGKDMIFSQFVYDFSNESIIHMRQLISATDDLYTGLCERFPDMAFDISKMCLLDFITRQDDRHLSNIAVLMWECGQRLYHLYDNGRSLFYEDTEEVVADAITDIQKYATSFGPIGTYADVVESIRENWHIDQMLNLNVTERQIDDILRESGFTGYRLEGGRQWIMNALKWLW
jgi:hypothetical protein